MNIGEIIRTRRQELGLTLENIGDYVGVGKSTVRKGFVMIKTCKNLTNDFSFKSGMWRI